MTFLYDWNVLQQLDYAINKGSVKNAQQVDAVATVNDLVDNLKLNLLSGTRGSVTGASDVEKKNLYGQIFYKDITSLDAFLNYLEKNMIKIGSFRLVIDRGVDTRLLSEDQIDKYLKYKNLFVYASGIKQYLSNLSQSIQDPLVKNQLSKLLSEVSAQLKINLSSGQVPGASQSGGGAGAASSQQGASAAPGAAGSQAPGQSGTMGASEEPAFDNQQQPSQSSPLVKELVSSTPFQSTSEFDVYACVKFADNLKRLASNDSQVNNDLTQYYSQLNQTINSLRQFVAGWKGRVGDIGTFDYNLSGNLPTLADRVSQMLNLPADASGPNFKSALKDALGFLKAIVSSTIDLLNLTKKIRKLQPFSQTIDNSIGVGKRYFNDIQAQISRV